MNPCPCGPFGDLVHSCSCSSSQIARYLARISGPFLDRIPSRFAALQIEVPRLPHEDLLSIAPGESSAAVRERVCAARAIQQARFSVAGGTRRGRHADPGERGGSGSTGKAVVFANGGMGARQIRQHRRVGAVEHVAEAIQYRTLDRRLWG
jgi:magnesium chelatase family protein